MMKIRLLLVLLLQFVLVNAALAEELNTIFERVNQYEQAGNYPKALEELSWAKKEIEKKHIGKLSSLLPDTVAGFTGQPIKAEGALGFTSVERTYRKGGSTIQLSISGTSGGSGGPMGGLAGLGRMAAMMGANTPGNETVRIDGRTANIETMGSNTSMTIFLNSGSILKLDGRNTGTSDLRAAAGALNVNDIDSYLAGTAN